MRTAMWSPLSIPLAALSTLATVPRALAAVARTPDLMEAGLERMDALNERADLVLAELADARATFAEAMVKVDRLSDQSDRVLEQVAEAEEWVARLTGGGDKLLTEASAARGQLRETQAVLEEASERVQRALEMAEPLDRMTARAARIAGSLRRDQDS
jgi:chromosome segregation ATPase